MKPEPTADEVYESYLADIKEKNQDYDTVTICDLYFQIKKRYRGYRLETFQKMQEDMYLNWTNWNGYIIHLMQGHLTGVCTKYKKDRETIHPIGFWKFIEMIPIDDVKGNIKVCDDCHV